VIEVIVIVLWLILIFCLLSVIVVGCVGWMLMFLLCIGVLFCGWVEFGVGGLDVGKLLFSILLFLWCCI